MIDFNLTNDIIYQNIAKYRTNQSLEEEKIIAQLCEAAREISDIDVNSENALENLREKYKLFILPTLPPETAEFNRNTVRDIFSPHNYAERAMLCSLIAERLHEKGFRSEQLLGEYTPGGKKISYVKSGLSDNAFASFAKVIKKAAAEYADSFEAACEAVYYENCGACILPCETDDGGTLFRIRSLIKKYDLKKTAVCSIPTGGNTTEFALLRRSLELRSDSDTIEIDIVPDELQNLSAIINAAAVFGLSAGRVSAQPESFSESGRAYDLRFSGSSRSIRILLLYMSLEFPRFVTTGIFKAGQTDFIK